jgi:protein-S-isoprenylcysteine O-methyltransferase Ste14
MDGTLALVCTIFLSLTARIEERENIAYFGEEYAAYMQRSKRFTPFI